MGVEVLARLGGGVSSWSGIVGGGAVSGDALAGVELAALLSGLDDFEMAFALAKYVGDAAQYAHVRELVRQHSLSLRDRRAWKAAQDVQVLALADVAVDESVQPGVCPVCDGVRYVGAKVCKRCAGLGYVRKSNVQVARLIGVSEAAYRQSWADRFRLILGFVSDLDGAVVSAVYRNNRRFEFSC